MAADEATFSELVDSRTNPLDARSKGRGIRKWYVDVLPQAVRSQPGYAATQDWIDETLFFDSDEPVPHPDGKGSILTSYYSNDNTFRFPVRLEREDPSFNEFSLTKRDIQVKIPIATFVQKAQVVPDSVEQFIRHIWEADDDTYSETRVVWNKEITLQGTDLTFQAIEYLWQQNNSLHRISGHWYRFTFGDITPVGPDEWITTYSWERDRGTLELEPGGALETGKLNTVLNALPNDLANLVLAVPGRFINPFNEVDNNIYTRPPFHRVVGIPDGNELTFGDETRQVAPGFVAYQQYPVLGNGLGWQNLPGEPF